MKKYDFLGFYFTLHPSEETQSYVIVFDSQTMLLYADSTNLRVIHLNDGEIRQICKLFDKCHVEKWRLYYGEREEARGISWGFRLRAKNEYVCWSHGFNDFPEEWDKVRRFFQRYWDSVMKKPLTFGEKELA